MSQETKKAIKIIKQTNKQLLRLFGQKSSIKYKKHREIISSADLQINQFITQKLKKFFPDNNIISEEAKKIEKGNSKTWYIDPIDGTTNFVYGFPEFSVCLGLEENKQIKLGVVGIPTTNEIFHATKNQKAFCNKKPISVSQRGSFEQSMTVLCPGHSKEGKLIFHRILNSDDHKIEHWRFFASAGIELTAVASGKADICIITDTRPWDVLAGVIIIREAGGRVTNFEGEEWNKNHSTLLATNNILHNRALDLIKNSL